MKLQDIYDNTIVLSEGLIHVLGKILKYTVIAIGAAFLLRTVRNIIMDTHREEGEDNFYSVIGDTIQIERQNERRVKELLDVLADEMEIMVNANRSFSDYKKVSPRQVGAEDVDLSQGNLYNMNIALFVDDRSKLRNLERQLNIINDRYQTKFHVIKEGKVR